MIYAEASRSPDGLGGAWSFTADALCVRDAFHPDYGRDIPREIYMPGGVGTPCGPYEDPRPR